MSRDWSLDASYFPWARELSDGDKLSPRQGEMLCETRLRDFGLRLVNLGGYYLVEASGTLKESGYGLSL